MHASVMSVREITGQVNETHKEMRIEWKITDFSSLSAEIGSCYYSPSFYFMNASWSLHIYTGGFVPYEKEFIALFIETEHMNLLYGFKYTFGIKKSNGTVEQRTLTDYSYYEKFGFGYVIRHFLERSELLRRKSELLPSDALTITCVIKADTPHAIEVSHRHIKLIELEKLSENFKSLLSNKNSCDTTLMVKDKEFQAHKSILVARSTVFAAMFNHDTSENETGMISITDCDRNSFGDFLQYLYTGKADNMSPRKVLHLFKTADKYDVQELKWFCVRYMMSNLTAEIVFDVFTLANLYDLQELRSLCVQYMLRNLMVENFCDIVSLAQLYEETELLASAQEFFNENMNSIFGTPKWLTLMTQNSLLANKLLTEMSLKVKTKD